MYLATAQNKISSNTTENAHGIINLIREAAKQGADLVHFPESSLSGYIKTQISDWSTVNWDILEKDLNSIQEVCATLKIWVVLGCNHREQNFQRPYNSLYVIDDSGNIVSRYDKRFCSHTEISYWYSAGTTPKVIDIKGIKLGFLLCIEIHFPELFMEYEEHDVDCLLLSAYSDDVMFAVQAQGHAACNNYWISFSVPTNKSHNQSSQLIGPDGKIISVCEKGVSNLIINKINPNSEKWNIPCKKARPWRKLAKLGEIYEPFQRK